MLPRLQYYCKEVHLWALHPLTAGGIMVWHIRSPPRWWEASAGAQRVDVRSFQTLINAEGKSTLENLVLNRGGTAEPFITLSMNVLQTLGSSEGKASSEVGMSQEEIWGCWQGGVGDACRVLVSTLPGPEQGCLIMGCKTTCGHTRIWKQNTRGSTALSFRPTLGFFSRSGEMEPSVQWEEPREPRYPEGQRLSKKEKLGWDCKSLRDWIIQESGL